MANCAIFVSDMNIAAGDLLRVIGIVRVSTAGEGSDPISFELLYAWTGQTSTLNNEIIAAGVAAATLAGFEIGSNDKKVLFCGAA